MDEILLCDKDVKCTSGNDLNLGSTSISSPPSGTGNVTIPFTPILYVTINTQNMNNPKILFKFSGILSYTITATSQSARAIILARSSIRISRKSDDFLIPVSQDFTNIKVFSLIDINAIRPQTDSSSLVFNFCHSPQNCTCSKITYVLEVSSVLTIMPNTVPIGSSITINGSLHNNELFTMAYDCEN